MGGLRQTAPRSLLATSTHNYHQTSVRFGVLASSFELSSMDILLYPYPTIIWLAIGAMLVLATLLLLGMEWLLPEHGNKGNSLLGHGMNLELIMVGMPMLQAPSSSAKRMYCIMLMFYTLLIRTVYQGKLFHLVRTHQLNRLPQTIEELVEGNYTVVVSFEMHEMLAAIPAVQHMQFHRLGGNSTPMQAPNYLAAHPQDRRLVAASGIDFFMRFNRQSAYRAQLDQRAGNHFELIPLDVLDMQLTMYLRKHSFLIDEFNEQIMWMRSVGLLAFWARWELDESYLWSEHASSIKMFDLEELHMLFLLVLLGLSLGLVLFALELASLRSARLRRWFLAQI